MGSAFHPNSHFLDYHKRLGFSYATERTNTYLQLIAESYTIKHVFPWQPPLPPPAEMLQGCGEYIHHPRIVPHVFSVHL